MLKMDIELRVRDLEQKCQGVLSSNKDRDHLIIITFALVVAYLAYMWYSGQLGKSHLDNRNRAIPLQLLDHTGATNYSGFKQYGVE